MPSSGGGGSIIINKSGYDMTPYSNLPTNNTNNLRIEDINQRFTEGFNNYHNNQLLPALNNYDRSIIQPQLQNVNNKFDEFEAGFKNYHDNFIQPSCYEAGRNHDALNTKINTNRLNSEIDAENQKQYVVDHISKVFEDGFNNYHNHVVIPLYDTQKLNNQMYTKQTFNDGYNNYNNDVMLPLQESQKNDVQNQFNEYNQSLTSIYRNQKNPSSLKSSKLQIEPLNTDIYDDNTLDTFLSSPLTIDALKKHRKSFSKPRKQLNLSEYGLSDTESNRN